MRQWLDSFRIAEVPNGMQVYEIMPEPVFARGGLYRLAVVALVVALGWAFATDMMTLLHR